MFISDLNHRQKRKPFPENFLEMRRVFNFGENFEPKTGLDFLELSEMGKTAEAKEKLDVRNKLSFLKDSISENMKERMLEAETLHGLFSEMLGNDDPNKREEIFLKNKEEIISFMNTPEAKPPFVEEDYLEFVTQSATGYGKTSLQNMALKRWIIYKIQSSETTLQNNKKAYDLEISRDEANRMKERRPSQEEEYNDMISGDQERNEKINNILNDAINLKGKLPYIWGGTSLTTGADCSGFTQALFKRYGKKIPRTAYPQSTGGVPVSRYNLEAGDLVFFKTTDKRDIPVTHVGIYMGDGNFIHEQSRKTGIQITSLDNSGYSSKFVNARRYI